MNANIKSHSNLLIFGRPSATSMVPSASLRTLGLVLACAVSTTALAADFGADFDADQDEQYAPVMVEKSYYQAEFPEYEYQAGQEPEEEPEPEEVVIPVRDDQPSGSVFKAKSGGSASDTYHSGIESTTKITITTASHSNSGTASGIRFYIGDHYKTLAGAYNPSTSYTWNFADSTWWRNIYPDDWDHIRLQATSTDGVKIAHVTIKHNGWTILDTDVNAWLDKDYAYKLVFDNEIAMKKWSQLGNTRNPVLYYAVMDLGKSGHQKYVNDDTAWCSEFASYAIKKGTGLPTPPDSIWVQDMKDFFASIGRLYDKGDVEDGTYEPKAGDYISINNRGHSTIFVKWVSRLNTFQVIDGNWGNRVRIRTVNWSDVGNSDGIGSIYGAVY